MVRLNEDYIIPSAPGNLARIVESGEYPEGFAPFLGRILKMLEGSEWPPGSYFPGGLFRELLSAGRSLDSPEFKPLLLARFHLEELVVERSGVWRVGSKIIRGRVLEHFLRNLEFDPLLERYLIRYRLEKEFDARYIHHNSPPFRVRRVVIGEERLALELNDGSAQPLKPDTLRMDQAEQLYCAVKAPGLPALFEERARWEILSRVEEHEGGWRLKLADKEFPLELEEPLNFPGGTGPPD